MDYLTTVEAAKKWNISSRMAAYYCEAGRVKGAVKKGKAGWCLILPRNLWINDISKGR